jgi:hypothetical protein
VDVIGRARLEAAALAIAIASCTEEPKDPAPLTSGAGSLPTASVGAAQPTAGDDGDGDEDGGGTVGGGDPDGTGAEATGPQTTTGLGTTTGGGTDGTAGGGTLGGGTTVGPAETESHEDGMPPLTTTEIPPDDGGLLPDDTDG